jgi:hypothetical protein
MIVTSRTCIESMNKRAWDVDLGPFVRIRRKSKKTGRERHEAFEER